MKSTFRYLLPMTRASLISSAVFTGCQKPGDAISSAEKQDEKSGITAPGIEETKAIAEEGFIYGLPLVMNYAVMYEYAVEMATLANAQTTIPASLITLDKMESSIGTLEFKDGAPSQKTASKVTA